MLEKFLNIFERIAVALEVIAGKPAAKAPAKKAPAKKAPAKKAAEPAAEPTKSEEPVAEVEYATVVERLQDVAKKVNRDAALKLVAEYGGVKVPDLKGDPSKFAEIVAKADALIAAAS